MPPPFENFCDYAVRAFGAEAKKSSEKPISALDAEVGDMIQYGAKA